MRRLSGVDAGLLALEQPAQPMDVLAVCVLGDGAALTVEGVRRHVAARLDGLPGLRGRLVPVPGGIGRPLLVEDMPPDLAAHVGEHRLADPGDEAQLNRFCARIAEKPLDRRRPLWHLTLVKGLTGERQALVLRVHHCLVDGAAVVNTFGHLFDRPEDWTECREGNGGDGAGSTDRDARCASPRWTVERKPSAARLLVGATADQLSSLRQLPALVRRTRRGSKVVRSERAASASPPPGERDAPGTVVNLGFAPERRLARTQLASAELAEIKDAAGVTFNDVALATVAGALRRYLMARRALPDRPLVARVPVSLEARGTPPRMSGNRISALLTTLATDVPDPWQRLLRIGSVTAEAKRLFSIAGPALLDDWLTQLPPAVLGRAVRHGLRVRQRHPDRIDANVTVSNVRGPAPPQLFGGALVEGFYLTGPPNSGVATNIVLVDHGGRLHTSILTFADSVDDPTELATGMHTALAELRCAADAHGLRPASRRT